MMRDVAPPGYKTVETDRRVPGTRPEFRSRLRRRALRRAARLNAGRRFNTYRYEVVREQHRGKRWAVYAFQNVAAEAG